MLAALVKRESLPHVQYAATAEGESVAFCCLGEGPDLVVVPSGPWAAMQIQWGVQLWQSWNRRLAERRRVILYDSRGAGLSDPPGSGAAFQLASQVVDLQAVVERLGLERFALFAAQHAGPAAIAFAARHPEQVSHLVLWCSYARGSDYFSDARSAAVHHVLGDDWELFTETIAHAQLGWAEGESASRLAALLREHLNQATIAAFDMAARASDVAALLPLVNAPVLVLHRRQLRHPELAISRHLAAGLRDARLVVLEGEAVAPFVGDVQAGLEAIDAFFGASAHPAPRQAKPTAAAGQIESLTARESDVLRLLAVGFSNAEVGRELVIAAGTVKTHTASIYRKLDVDNRTRAVARARELGLLDS